MVELKDLGGPESTGGRHATDGMQLVAAPTPRTPLREAHDEAQSRGKSVSAPRTSSPARPEQRAHLEHECDNSNDNQLRAVGCKCNFNARAKSNASHVEAKRGAQMQPCIKSDSDNSAQSSKMREQGDNAGQQDQVAEQPNRPTDAERRLRPQKYCSVCGDKAIACNFNAVTCESCKAFFRRNAFKEQRLRCLFENRCVIDRVTRRFCSKCRLLKCLAIGMKREWILTEEQKQIKRVKIMQNRQTRHQQQVSTTQSNGNSSGSDETTESSGHVEAPHSRELPAGPECQQRPRRVETRDVAVSCPDEGAPVQVQCSFAHQCQFCSLRLSGQPPAAGLLEPFRGPAGHHQVLAGHYHQPLSAGHNQRHAHYHYSQQAPGPVYSQQQPPPLPPPPPSINPAQAWPLNPMAVATCCQADPALGVASHQRPGGPELAQGHHHHHQGQYDAPAHGVIVNGSSQVLSLQAAVGERDCCCPGGKLRAPPTCHVEPATSTTSSTNQLAAESGGGGASQELQPAHLHELNPSRKPDCMSCPGAGGSEWPGVCAAPGESAAGNKSAEVAGCDERSYEQRDSYISNECDTAPGESEQAGVYSQGPNADSLVEWRGELFVKPAFSEQETMQRIAQLELSPTERQLVLEMEAATRQILDIVEKPSNDSALDDIIFFLDVALKSLIKSVKKIGAFRMLSMDDQIVLLKNACFKILLVRSCLYYNDQIEGWMDRFGHVKYLRVLKNDMCNNYERHKELLEKLARPLRRDRPIIMFLIMVVLFDPTTPGLKSAHSIQLDNLVYLSALRKYLLATQPEPLAKYERLVEALRVMNVCNEEYNLFFSRKYQPEQITPLLIEIFDISVNSPAQ